MSNTAPATARVSVPASELQRLVQWVREARAPKITWNEAATVMHERADKRRRECLEEIEESLETILGPDLTPID